MNLNFINGEDVEVVHQCKDLSLVTCLHVWPDLRTLHCPLVLNNCTSMKNKE